MSDGVDYLIDGMLIVLGIIIAVMLLGIVIEHPRITAGLAALIGGFLGFSVIAGYLWHHLPERVRKWR